jgi:hypothetical protein
LEEFGNMTIINDTVRCIFKYNGNPFDEGIITVELL